MAIVKKNVHLLSTVDSIEGIRKKGERPYANVFFNLTLIGFIIKFVIFLFSKTSFNFLFIVKLFSYFYLSLLNFDSFFYNAPVDRKTIRKLILLATLPT